MNFIRNLEPLQFLLKLEYLDLIDNSIKKVDSLHCLQKIPHLRCMYLQDLAGETKNPVCDVKGYRKSVLAILPKLKRLDGVPREFE